MRLVALLTVRNESLYLARCLEHLIANDIEVCVIDNESTDSTRRIAEGFLGRGVMRIERIPYGGAFELLPILRNEERLARELDAEWFMHHDADEIRESPFVGSTLKRAIEKVDAEGYNAVNFDEFVFVPTGEHERFEGRDYVAEMRHYYYYFWPGRLHRLNAWKSTGVPVDLCGTGGHQVQFAGRRMYPMHFIMRHYIALSWDHLGRKYQSRQYSPDEVMRLAWHGSRTRFDLDVVRRIDWSRLKVVTRPGEWDRSDPWKAHPMFPRTDQPAAET